ncbi:hypothetical protein PANT_7c00162 [Moesziomyces antarcticus T-34]|uniref:Uncharacterized protein n=1 Tax=Pseudozyma antarctica (strain T-34) TaxID=1151754 RepID=M9LM39_PSEA3|nr:hypothetical protein PANT_7c00162 [Moesziomyces antarcticus T-34]
MSSLRASSAARSIIRLVRLPVQPRSLQVLPRFAQQHPQVRALSSTSRRLSSPPSSPSKSPSGVGNVETPGFRPRPSVNGPGAVRIGTLFASLITLAVVVTGYGLYEYYTSFSAWPVSIRDDLRAALKARNRGDARRSENFFRKALATARSIKGELNEPTPTPKGQPAGLKGEGMLKISGIAIALAALLEGEGRVVDAYDVLQDVWDEVMETGMYARVAEEKGEVARTDRDKMRAVQIAQKLGMLGQLPEVRIELLNRAKQAPIQDAAEAKDDAKLFRFSLTGTAASEDPAERWLVWSVEELFRLILPADVHASALAAAAAPPAASKDKSAPAPKATLTEVEPPTSISLADLDLPAWVTKLDVLSSVEALGTFYAAKSVPEFAVPLYLQALSILLPPSTPSANRSAPTASERCKAGLIMNNLSQLLSGSNIKDASKWALKGLEITDTTVQKAGFESQPSAGVEVVQSSQERTNEVRLECLGVKLTLLYNLGVLSDMAGDKCSARVYFQKTYALASKLEGPAFTVAKNKAAESLARLERRSAAK